MTALRAALTKIQDLCNATEKPRRLNDIVGASRSNEGYFLLDTAQSAVSSKKPVPHVTGNCYIIQPHKFQNDRFYAIENCCNLCCSVENTAIELKHDPSFPKVFEWTGSF